MLNRWGEYLEKTGHLGEGRGGVRYDLMLERNYTRSG